MKGKRVIYAFCIIIMLFCIIQHPFTVQAEENRKIELTEEEQSYIEQHQTITIANLKARAPLSSYDEGTKSLVGINEDILSLISQISGLEFELVPLPLGIKPTKALKEGNFDLVAGMARTDNLLRNENYVVSEPFMTSNVVPIVKNGNSYDPSDDLSIAIPDSFQALDEYIKKSYPHFSIKYYQTNDECLKAVADGKVDVTMQNEYLVTYLLQNPRYKQLEIIRAYFFEEKDAIAGLSSIDPRLISIINKAIQVLPKNKINQIIVANTATYRYTYTLADLLYMYRVPVIAIAILVLVCIGMLSLIIFIRHRNLTLLRGKNEELEDMVCQLEIAKQDAVEAMEDAERANKAKSIFLSRMSHEIRTPMNAIIGLTTLTKRVVKDNIVAMDNLEKISFSSKTLLNIINDVLDMSAIESNKLRIGNNPFDFKSLITSVAAMYYPMCKERGITFDLYLSGVTEEALVGDQLRLNQILNNLLSNALKFTPSGGNIKLIVKQVKVEDKKVYMQFSVTDTGCGISEEMKARMFEPFEQESTKTAMDYGGSGLGLSITKSLATLMQGAISVESVKGKGSTFTVNIPFSRSSVVFQGDTQKLKDITAMIIDDDQNTRDYISTVLDRMDVKHEAASTGEEGIRKLKQASCDGKGFDVCFVDWKMPDMDGVVVTRKIRELFDENTLIIIISAYDLNEVQEIAKENGANLFLPKPLFQSTVFDVLMNLSRGSYVKPSLEPEQYDYTGHKIMLVDDTEFNLDVAKELLEIVGIEVTCAKNGKEAYDLFVNAPVKSYDMILMDVQMPVMNGHDATKAIRKSGHPEAETIPILAMTANAFTEDITESFAAGMNDHLTKPIDADVLYRTIGKFF